MITSPRSVCVLLSASLFIAVAATGHAEDPEATSVGDLAKQTQNPVADLISLPLQNNFFFSEDGGDMIWNLNVQPVIPISLNDDWNLIARTIAPLFAFEDAPAGSDSFGLGDINASLFFSPNNDSPIIWGFGPIFSFPTATSDIFGSGQWSAGPTFVALTMSGPWVIGGLVNHLWSYAGDDDRGSVNATLVQPFINYNFNDGWYGTFAPIMTANWQAESGDRWTVPLGGGVGRVFSIGKQPINTSLQAYYNVERPEGGAEWSARFQVQFLFPK